jgi:hypothetical protein
LLAWASFLGAEPDVFNLEDIIWGAENRNSVRVLQQMSGIEINHEFRSLF